MEAISKFDFYVLDFIQKNLRCDFLDVVMVFFTRLGDGGLIWIVLTVAFLISNKYRKLGAAMAIALLLSLFIGNGVLKEFFARQRPFHVNDTALLIEPPSGHSFPSAHTMSSFAAATPIFFFKKKWGAFAYSLASLIAFSRMYLYVHFFTDVFFGAIFGILFGWAGFAAIFRRLKPKRGRRYE